VGGIRFNYEYINWSAHCSEAWQKSHRIIKLVYGPFRVAALEADIVINYGPKTNGS
jgi:hypothetical protein